MFCNSAPLRSCLCATGLSSLAALVHAQVSTAPPNPFAPPTLQVAYPFDEDASQMRAFNFFVDALRRQQIAFLQPIPAYKYGDSETAVLDAVRKGQLDLAFVPFSVMAKIDPGYGVFTTPFLFDDFKHLTAVQKGSIGQRLLGELRRYGVQGLGWWAGEFVTMAGDRPVVDPRDIADKTIAFQPKTAYGEVNVSAVPDFSRAFGALPLSLPRPSSPQAIVSTRGANLFEVVPQRLNKLERPPSFITLTNHLNAGYVVVASSAKWDNLPAAFRDRFPKALEIAYDFNSRDLQARQGALLAGAAPGNPAVLPLTKPDRPQWLAAFPFPERGPEYAALVAQIKDAVVPQLVSAPAPPAKISWNAWLEDTAGKDIESLTVGKVSTISLDLGRLPYKRRLTAPPDSRIASALKSNVPLRLLIQPVMLGSQLEAAPSIPFTAQIATVSLKNAMTLPTDEAKREAHWDGRLSTRALAGTLGLGEIVKWSVKANQEGCADVAFSVWDEARVEPLDHIVVSLPVQTPGGAKVTCYGMSDSQDMAAGLQTLLREPRKNGLIADASLQIFEYEKAGQVHTAAILLHAKRHAAAMKDPAAADPGVYSWELVSSLSEYMSSKEKLPELIAAAHRQVDVNDPFAYESVVGDMASVLFAGNLPRDAAQAKLASAAFKDAVENGDPAKIFMRLVDKQGQAIFLPIGLLAARSKTPFVSKKFSVYQSLPGPTSSDASCIGSWHVARSSVLEGAKGVAEQLLADAPTQISSSAELLPTHQDVARYLASQPTVKRGEGFIMLAHHADGSLRFTREDRPPPRISSDTVSRLFPGSSMGVLAACTASGPGQTSSFVNRLASQGMSTIVLSPFPVDIEYGVRLALAFERRAAMEGKSPSGATAATLFEQSAADVAASMPETSALQDMALEFQLAGNPDLTFCKAPKE